MRRLVTIPISHYCEKARWALDRAGIPYREERHVQLVHQFAAKRAGGGLTVPVLVDGDDVYPESEDIVRHADAQLPAARRLFPEDPAQLDDVVTLSRRLDEGLGPDGRRWIYAQMIKQRALMLDYNNQGVPGWEDRALRIAFPAAAWAVSRHLGVGPTTIADDEPKVRASFDEMAARLADGRPFLCGERFSAADLTFACLAAPVIGPGHYGVPLPQPDEFPAGMAASVRSFREHPAGAFALRMYATERGAPVPA